jgi:hypothetical protein
MPTKEISSKKESPSFQDLYLSKFQKNNPTCELAIEDQSLMINNAWGSQEARILFNLSDLDSIKDMNNVSLNPQFDAIIHLDSNQIEFLWGYIDPTGEYGAPIAERKFEFYFQGYKYKCFFGNPSTRLLKISSCFHRTSGRDLRGLRVVFQMAAFRDGQKIEQLRNGEKKYFENKVPRNFFIEPELPLESIDLKKLARHLNFLMRYYDRQSPHIIIRKLEKDDDSDTMKAMRFLDDAFPETLALDGIDDFILTLLEVARESSKRFSFIYYYQVFEYAGFYFLDDKARKELRQFLRDPALISCAEDKISDLFTYLTELNQADDYKMQKVIEEFCDPKLIWREIENNKDFFTQAVKFEGGFELPALIAPDTSESTWATMWMPKLYNHLTKIRNCIVHAREKRQNNVILPTNSNNQKIARYLPILERMTEQIALGKQ